MKMTQVKKKRDETRSFQIDTDGVIKDFYDKIAGRTPYLPIQKLYEALEELGIFPRSDPKLKELRDFLDTLRDKIHKPDFLRAASLSGGALMRAICGGMIITDFKGLKRNIQKLYDVCKMEDRGKVSNLTPYLSEVSPDSWELSLYSIINRNVRLGKTMTVFTIESAIRPFLFALAIELLGVDKILKHVGLCFYPGSIDDINVLDKKGIPCNSNVNCGGLALCSWLRNLGFKNLTKAEIFDSMLKYLKDLSGGKFVKFSNTAYMSEKDVEAKSRAMMHFLKMQKCLPENTNIESDIDFYFITCAFQVTVESLSIMGATLANYGVNPLSGRQVLRPSTCKNTLSMMNYCTPTPSWARDVGLPATYSVSGSILLVVPGIFSIALYSPRISKHYTSMRAEQFCIALISQYELHPYEKKSKLLTEMTPERTLKMKGPCRQYCNLLTSAAYESPIKLACMVDTSFQACFANYFGRNLLHEAAAAGNLQGVKFCMELCPHLLDKKDVMGSTPLDDAKLFGYEEVVEELNKWVLLNTAAQPEDQSNAKNTDQV